MNERPRVFISYSHEDGPHDGRVLNLSQRLREDGYDCHVDRYDPNPKQGWPRWMVEQIDRADYVLMVCTEVYRRRVMGEEAPGVGHGVIWESNLIYQYLYDGGTTNERFVPLLLGDADAAHIPSPLRGSTYYRIREAHTADQGYEGLCKLMRGEHRVPMAPLGSRTPDVVDAERSAALVSEAAAGDPESVTTSLLRLLSERQDPCERYWIYVTLGAVGGEKARATLMEEDGPDETDAFTRIGVERAIQLLEQTDIQKPGDRT